MTKKSAICDSCGLGKKSRMKPHREEKSVMVPEHFPWTQHCSDAGAGMYSVGPYFPTFDIVANRKLGNLSQHTGANRRGCKQRRLSRNCSSCPDPVQASCRLRALISGPICSQDMIGVLS